MIDYSVAIIEIDINDRQRFRIFENWFCRNRKVEDVQVSKTDSVSVGDFNLVDGDSKPYNRLVSNREDEGYQVFACRTAGGCTPGNRSEIQGDCGDSL